MPTSPTQFQDALGAAAPEFGIKLDKEQVQKLNQFYELLLKWNPRLHLVAPCSAAEFATRHVLESLLLLKHLTPHSRVIDIGSGGGLPIIPCLLLRDDLQATLFESQQRKAVFLREVLRTTKSDSRAGVNSQRFEEVEAPDADFVTCRALDKFDQLLPELIRWAPARSTFLFFAGKELRDRIRSMLESVVIETIPQSEARFLIVGRTK